MNKITTKRIQVNKYYYIKIMRHIGNNNDTLYCLFNETPNNFTRVVDTFNTYSFIAHCKDYIRITKKLEQEILGGES